MIPKENIAAIIMIELVALLIVIYTHIDFRKSHFSKMEYYLENRGIQCIIFLLFYAQFVVLAFYGLYKLILSTL